jgi:hypothetical protein
VSGDVEVPRISGDVCGLLSAEEEAVVAGVEVELTNDSWFDIMEPFS